MELNKNLVQLGKRVYNNKMMDAVEGKPSDEAVIKELVKKAFNENNTINDIQQYRNLNQLIVTTAEDVAKPNIQKTINLVAQYKTVGTNDIMEYDVNDHNFRVTMALSATGSGVDFTKIPSYKQKIFAQPRKHQFGTKYSISRMVSDPVQEFKNAVNLVAEEKVKYIMSQIYIVTRQAVTASKIPTKQILSNAGILFPDFRKVESSLLRYGNNVRPVLIGDTAFIGSLAEKQAGVFVTGTTDRPLYLTEDLKESLLRDITIDQVSKTMCISIDNPYTDRANSKVDLPVNEAIMVAGGVNSPFRVTEFGAMGLLSDDINQHIETEEAFLKISYKVDVTLLLNRAVAYLKDTSVTL